VRPHPWPPGAENHGDVTTISHRAAGGDVITPQAEARRVLSERWPGVTGLVVAAPLRSRKATSSGPGEQRAWPISKGSSCSSLPGAAKGPSANETTSIALMAFHESNGRGRSGARISSHPPRGARTAMVRRPTPPRPPGVLAGRPRRTGHRRIRGWHRGGVMPVVRVALFPTMPIIGNPAAHRFVRGRAGGRPGSRRRPRGAPRPPPPWGRPGR
jgi:hypothetical protein